ncbi:hypothetical protein DENIS_5027 [Desulfonema ishimotonii]|uniref:4Fe-4S Wbl-type domain-containing protein n=1 Tax=Desulfonema ishimotonii TaxID=45657 RepID=A0A401G465_9BACT|nr:hypothetical protein [Desulfonema ishimotonii]GBC64027.1 hypothetical protein DENIS_5027 [Desulfonema ishimotonii]
MTEERKIRPGCFGNLEKVFPMGEDGLRHSPEECMQCPDRTECLRAGMSGEGGLRVRDEKVDWAYESGSMGFFERWSRKKALHRKKTAEKEKRGDDENR